MFYNIHPTESISQLIWKEGLSSSDLRAQVEGKDRLRNGTLLLQLVKDGDGSWDSEAGATMASGVDVWLGLGVPACPSEGKRLASGCHRRCLDVVPFPVDCAP